MQNIKLLQYNIINLTSNINIYLFLIVDNMENDTAPAHYLKTSFVDFEKSSTKDYFFRPCQTLYTFLSGIKKSLTLLTYPFHHFFIVFIYYWGGYRVTFNIISVISWRLVLVVNETGVPRENHRPIASHWLTLSHNVVSSTPRHEWDSNSQF